MQPLHAMNPCRLGFIREAVLEITGGSHENIRVFQGLTALDIGCGGGILCEPMARLGAAVTGIDPAQAAIDVARDHARNVGLSVDYRTESVESVVARGGCFDIVTALEVIEHVVDPKSFLALAMQAVKPNGVLFVSTLNRTLRSFALAIVGAEYVLRWLPVGTHDWKKFVTPAELSEAARAAGGRIARQSGMLYNPVTGTWRLGADLAVNYIAAITRAGPVSREAARSRHR
jgi:2-polyprenyl-6-hydroxyphenyl methylase/3-demethylubiquinone-9 3-methyltransferase